MTYMGLGLVFFILFILFIRLKESLCLCSNTNKIMKNQTSKCPTITSVI